jgi:hypothetical protein
VLLMNVYKICETKFQKTWYSLTQEAYFSYLYKVIFYTLNLKLQCPNFFWLKALTKKWSLCFYSESLPWLLMFDEVILQGDSWSFPPLSIHDAKVDGEIGGLGEEREL